MGGGAWLAQSGPARGWGPSPPVHTGGSAAGPPPGPHDAGHLLQQKTVVPVDDGQPATAELPGVWSSLQTQNLAQTLAFVVVKLYR